MSISSNIFYAFAGLIVLWLLFLGVLLLPTDPSNEPSLASTEVKEDHSHLPIPKKVILPSNYKTEVRSLKKRDTLNAHPPSQKESQPLQIHIPLAAEWLSIRSEGKDVVRGLHGDEKVVPKVDVAPAAPKKTIPISVKVAPKPKPLKKQPTGPVKPANELSWPPVLKDGKISESDGSDTMPLIDIEVPRFWFPAEGADYNKVGSKIHGEETIFLMIASYRDFQCRETITSAYLRSDHPERLFVGAVDQTVPGDIGCLDLEIPCSQDNTQMICKYRDQISVYNMDAQYATGPVTARHVGDRMYRGEYFVMQMDAHCQFVRHWDKLIINQWRSTHNEMAVLTSYLTDVQGSFTPEGDSTRNTRPIMCNSDYEGQMPARYLRHGSQPEGVPAIQDMPQLEPFWAAGFSFSRGHFKLRVPYDAYQPMVFQGEEIAVGIRGFTHGYDFYAPKDSVVFHEYASKSARRKKIPMFWENTGHAGLGQNSLKRGTAVIGMAPDLEDSAWDHSELERYGLGTARPVELFYKLFLIDTKARKATQLCPFVKSGLMHKAFQPFLRPDGLGIDYNQLTNYDTRTVLENHLLSQHPYWEKQIKRYIEVKDRASLRYAIGMAERIGLAAKKPALIEEAKRVAASG